MSTAVLTSASSASKRAPDSAGPSVPSPKRHKVDHPVPMDVDETGGVDEKDAANKAFLNQVKKTTDTLCELNGDLVKNIWFSDRYDVPKYQSKRVDVGTGPPTGKRTRPLRRQVRIRGRLDHKYGCDTGQYGLCAQVNVEGSQAVAAAAFNEYFTNTAIDRKWHPKHKDILKKGGLGVLRSKVTPVFKIGDEKLDFVKDDADNKIPDPDDEGKFLMKSYDPPQAWPSAVRAYAPKPHNEKDYEKFLTRVVDQHGNQIAPNTDLNGMACIAVFEFTFVNFKEGTIGLGKQLVGLRVNTDDKVVFGNPGGGVSDGADSFF